LSALPQAYPAQRDKVIFGKAQVTKMAETKEVKTKAKKTSFWKGIRQEWDKIIWTPTKDLGKQTALVVVISILMGIIITVADSASLRLIEQILGI
jgi:preprotein translocase subunit SecE